MKASGFPWTKDRRGVAAVEFALVAPVLLGLLGSAADFGLVFAGKSKLANGVAQGIQYALLIGPGVSAAGLQAAVTNGALRSGLTQTVAVSVSGPACYCVSGTPSALAATSTALSARNTCTAACPVNTTGPNAYVRVVAKYTYQPLMPFYSKLASSTVSETVAARLQ